MIRRNTNMAVAQRTWMILIRPYYGNGAKSIYYTGVPKAGIKSDLNNPLADYDIATKLDGSGVGMENWNTIPIDDGGWTEWYVTTSYDRLREKYKECLKIHAKEYTRIVEVISTDIMITPMS